MRIRPEIRAFSTKSTSADANRLELAGAKFLSYQEADSGPPWPARSLNVSARPRRRTIVMLSPRIIPLHRAQRLLMGSAGEETPPKHRLAGSPSAVFPRGGRSIRLQSRSAACAAGA